eukprot:6612231-Pyramimonas_sp.AAC.1
MAFARAHAESHAIVRFLLGDIPGVALAIHRADELVQGAHEAVGLDDVIDCSVKAVQSPAPR